MNNIFNVVLYQYPGLNFVPCKRLWEAQTVADKLYAESGYKTNTVVEYDGEIIYRAQKRANNFTI